MRCWGTGVTCWSLIVHCTALSLASCMPLAQEFIGQTSSRIVMPIPSTAVNLVLSEREIKSMLGTVEYCSSVQLDLCIFNHVWAKKCFDCRPVCSGLSFAIVPL